MISTFCSETTWSYKKNSWRIASYMNQIIKKQKFYWGRKGIGQADSLLKKKETPSCTFSELCTMCLAAMGITYLQPNWPPGLRNTRFHTRFPITKKNAITLYVVKHLFNLYGIHWCRRQCITNWPFWLWIMAVTWLYLPLTLSRLGLRNLGMWAWKYT